MLVFPNCKINLGLSVKNKRTDGYHNIETVFYPVPIRDALEILTDHSAAHLDFPQQGDLTAGHVTFSSSGMAIEGDPEDNLCVKAYRLLKKDFPQIPAIKLHLHKEVPIGAGLGGGSADGAFVLKALNEKFDLGIPDIQLRSYAVALGSDCPFFIFNEPCLATGRGELLTPVKVDLTGTLLVIVNPGIHINTGWAFSQLKRYSADQPGDALIYPLTEILSQPIDTWKEVLINEFEIPIFAQHPEIKTVKEKLYGQGALYVSMSGSGSSVYAIFQKDVKPVLSFPANYLLKQVLL